MTEELSIAIETSSRRGGLVLARGRTLLAGETFDAAGRHASLLVARLADLTHEADLTPANIDHLYVSIGPGSFTGLRVGVTVARTLAQVTGARCVAVPTALAVAENVRHLPWRRLAVIADARQDEIFATLLQRDGQTISQTGEPILAPAAEFLATAPKELLLIGEGLAHHDLTARSDPVAPQEYHLPTAEGVWRVGRRMADEGRFTEYHHLRPLYSRKPACET